MGDPSLKSGFTTGTCAAAAAKAALTDLMFGTRPASVAVSLLNGERLCIRVFELKRNGSSVSCLVQKDAGDDPDVTHKALIGAKVLFVPAASEEIVIEGGDGVGVVTKPGLEVPVGKPAINPGPIKMIVQSIRDVLKESDQTGKIHVEIFVPKGKALSRKTLNERLGIVGGISILGTTGVVKPMSHEAYTATIRSSISVALGQNLNRLVFTTGRRTERYAQSIFPELPVESFVQIGDFFKTSLQMAVSSGVTSVTLAVFFGKAVKMAQGFSHTHAKSARLDIKRLAEWIYAILPNDELKKEIENSKTARHVLTLLGDHRREAAEAIGFRMIRHAGKFSDHRLKIKGILFGFDGEVIFSGGDE